MEKLNLNKKVVGDMLNLWRKDYGITLMTLVITTVILLIITIIFISMLVGNNGIINNALEAKKATEEAIEKEQQLLTSAFENNYANYNGQLHLQGNNLVNQYGEKIQLRGLVGTAVSKYSIHYTPNNRFSYYLNDESIKVLKSWGTNVIRLGMEVEDVNNTTITQDYLNTIDLLLKNNMYVIVILWNNGKINDNIEIAKQYFDLLSKKYNNIPNIIYEIANEPTIDYNSIIQYSDKIISVIRKNDTKNIIIVPYTNYDSYLNLINIKDLKYPYNVMVSYHIYVGDSLTSENINCLEQAIKNKIPVFVTEWGTTLSNGNDGFYEDYANAFVQLMNNYNLSWCNFQISDLNFKVNTEYSGIVKNNQWNNKLEDDILTESGKYIKSILQKKCNSYNNEEYCIMMSRDNSFAFWQEFYRNKIFYIEFNQQKEVPDNIIEYWDISLTRNNSVIAYIKQKDNNYELYITSKHTINLPINCYQLFADFSNVKSIVFKNVVTDCVTDMGNMFLNCFNLDNIEGISEFNTRNTKKTYSMFNNCSNLKKLNLGKWNTSNFENILNMFAGCTELESIDGIENWKVSNVKNLDGAFSQTYNLRNLNLSNWDLKNVRSINETFKNSYVENLKLSNWDISNCSRFTGVFENTINLKNLYLNNIKLNINLITDYKRLFSGTKQGVNVYVENLEIAQFIFERLNDDSITGKVYYRTGENWIEYKE